MATVLHTFITQFIFHLELCNLGGEFGKAYCRETLTVEQGQAMVDALGLARQFVSTYPQQSTTLNELAAALRKSTATAVADTELPEGEAAFKIAVTHAFKKCEELCSSASGNGDGAGQSSRPARPNCTESPLRSIRVLGQRYFNAFHWLATSRLDKDAGCDDMTVTDFFVWTDTGIGLAHVIGTHVLLGDTSPTEFMQEMRDQILRTTLEDATREAERLLEVTWCAILVDMF
jgi:hypothetical protein